MDEFVLRLIVIDDNDTIQRDFTRILSVSPSSTNQLSLLEEELFDQPHPSKSFDFPSFKIDTASQGQEGVEKIKVALQEGQPYALAFVDIRMPPGWDGIETIKHIWALDKSIQIVICTAYSDYSWEETVNELGLTDNLIILKKPFDNITIRQVACALTKKWQLLKENDLYTHCLEDLLQQRTASLKESFSLVRSTLDSTAEGILVVDNNKKIIDYNKKFIELWQVPPSILENKDYNLFLEYAVQQVQQAEDFRKLMHFNSSIKTNEETSELVTLNNGHVYEVYSQPNATENHIYGRVWSFRDFTQRFLLEKRLQHQALHDGLTGLPNRILLEDRLNQAINTAKRKNSLFAVLFFDLDRFKLINDSLSHHMGDEILIAVADRVKSVIRKTDTFARMGGDEFVIILSDIIGKEDIYNIAEKILAALHVPFHLLNHCLNVTASIGICFYPYHGKTASELLQSADLAMYLAKGKGGNQYQLYQSHLIQGVHKRVEMEIELRTALDNNEFFLVYQPQYDASTNTIQAVESLIRWNHPKKGLLYPLDFLPMAEESGLIVPISQWVVRQACTQNKYWQENGYPLMRVVVNLETQFLEKPDFIDIIKNILKETKLDPAYLEFELTENIILSNTNMIQVINEIKKLGIKLSLDDFGTGNSSITYLKNLPIDKLKIDKSFVDGLGSNESDAVIIQAILAMARSLNLDVLVEGVETKEQLDHIKAYNCSNIQGYYFSKPLNAKELEQFIEKHQKG